jgi:hypothetical protein
MAVAKLRMMMHNEGERRPAVRLHTYGLQHLATGRNGVYSTGGTHVPSTIELRAFMGLTDTFRERNWGNPKEVEVQGEITGVELLALLDLPEDMVEVIFVNGKAFTPPLAVLAGGDRVALAPPGVPGPYRVLLGFKKMG